ncbi:hypothetical protein FLACOL_00623 [Flavobacterium columnare]|uniref:Lipocalin-like domain-containing protein n=2 Tax=Flavobacterium TaxID=237 RepID=A0ABW8PNF6_9FLAO|nr:hypothetical protein [Flavobacterium columnare]SPE76637.1 hypothetical protein FLACOL_00623 [Flavobacterium columnare]
MRAQLYLKVFFSLFLFFLFSCNYKNRFENGNEFIIGRWILDSTKKQINYPEIIFYKDSTAVFKSQGDTLYRFNYYLDGTFIALKDINNVKEKYKIHKLTKDSLSFDELRENEFRQTYTRHLRNDTK